MPNCFILFSAIGNGIISSFPCGYIETIYFSVCISWAFFNSSNTFCTFFFRYWIFRVFSVSVMSAVNRDNLLLLFLVGYLLFLCIDGFFWLGLVVPFSRNRAGSTGLFLLLERSFHSIIIYYDVSCKLCMCGLLCQGFFFFFLFLVDCGFSSKRLSVDLFMNLNEWS